MDQVGIPGSNMFKIFPLLFAKTKKNQQYIGLEELKEKIQEMGLEDYLTSKSLEQLGEGQRGKGSAKNIPVKTNLSEAWWYIGP